MPKQLNVNLAFTADTSQAAMQVQNLQRQLTNLVNQPVGIGQKITTEIQQASNAAAELKMHLQSATNVKTGTLDFGRLNQSLQASGQSLSQYAAKLQALGPQGQQAFMSLARSVANAEVPLRRSNALLTSFATTLANTARWQLSSMMLHGFISSVSQAWNYSKDLNQSLNNIRIVTGKNVDEMARFADQANRAAKALSTTTTEYTNASLIYYQQGLSDEEVLGRAETTLKLANVSRQSAETVSDQMTAIWNNFYDGSKSLEYYADVITALGAATASSSDEIAQGLEKFAAVAETVGLSYEYATAALATVTATTRLSADVVGTAFKTLFARLSDLKLGETLDDGTTLGSYSENLAKIGVNIKDASGNLKDMDTILDETAAKWSNLDKAQQVALAKGVAGIRQYTQFIALMDNWDFMEKNLDTVSSSSGTLQKQADIYAESWSAASKRVKASLETIYESVMDDEFFIKLTNGFADLIEGVGGFVKSIGGLQGVLSGLGWVLTKVFADQMAKGFQNLAYNIQMSTEAGRQAVTSMKAQEMQAFATQMGGFDETTQLSLTRKQVYSEELQMQAQLLTHAENLTSEERLKLQYLLDQSKAIGEQSIQLAEQLEMQKQLNIDRKTQLMGRAFMANNADSTGDVIKAFAEVDVVADKIGQINTQIRDMRNASEVSSEGVKTLETSLANLGMGETQIKNLTMGLEGLRGADASSVLDNIAGSVARVSAETAEAIVNLMGYTEGSQGYTQAYNRVQEYLQGVARTTTLQNDLTISTENGTQSMKNFGEAVANAGAKTQSTAQLLSQAASGLMSLGMLASSFSGLMDAIQDKDLSAWDRFSRILMSVSMVSISLIGTFKLLKTVSKLLTAETIKSTVSKAAELATTASLKSEESKLAAVKAMSRKESVKYVGQLMKENAAELVTGKKKLFAGVVNRWNTGSWNALNAGQQRSYLQQSALNAGYRQTKKGVWYGQTPQGGWSFMKEKDVFADKKVAKGAQSAAGKASLKSMGTSVAGWAAIVAGIALIAGTITIAVNQYNKHNIAAKNAAKAAEEAATSFNNVSQAYTDFNQKTDTYDDAVKGLSKLTKGTDEYKEATLKANEAAMDLLNTYTGLQYTVNADGLIIIDEDSLAEARQLQEEAVKNAQMANLVAQNNSRRASVEAKSVEFQRNKLTAYTSEDLGEEALNTGIAGGAGAAGGALIVGGAAALIGKSIAAGMAAGPWGALIGAVIGLTAAIGTAIATGNANKREAEALEKLAVVYAEQGNAKFASDTAFEKLLREELKLDDENLIKSLIANREETAKLAAEMAEVNARANAQNTGDLYDEYADDIATAGVEGEDNAMQISKIAAAQMKKVEDEIYKETYKDGFGNLTDKEVQQLYAEKMGYATDTVENMSGNKAKYYNKDGSEVGVISDDVARRYLAHLDAIEKMGGTVENVTEIFKDLTESGDAASEALLKWAADKSTDDFTMSDYEAFIPANGEAITVDTVKEQILASVGSEANAAALGIDLNNLTGFVEALNNFEKQLEEVINQFNPKVKNALDEIEKSSGGLSKKATADIGQQITNVQKAVGDEAANLLTDIYKSAGAEAEALYDVFNKIDWSTATPDDLITALDNAKIETSFTVSELQSLCDSLYQVSETASQVSFADIVKNLKEVSKLTQGESINADVYNKLTDDMKSYFSYMSDGTYKLTRDALDFYQATQSAIKKTTSETQKRLDFLHTDLFEKDLSNILSYQAYDSSILQENYKAYEEYMLNLFNKEQLKSGDVIDEYTDTYGKKHTTKVGQVEAGKIVTDENGNKMIQGSRQEIYSDGGYSWTTQSAHIFNEQQWQDAGNKQVRDNLNSELFLAQLELLSKTDWGQDAENAKKLERWNQLVDQNALTVQDVQEVTKLIEQNTEQIQEMQTEYKQSMQEAIKGYRNIIETAKTAQEREEAFEEASRNGFGSQTQDAYLNAQQAAINEEAFEGLNVEEVNEYAQHLRETLQLSEEDAEEAARATMKYTKGIEALADGYKDWVKVLKTTDEASEDAWRAMAKLKTALSDIIDVSEEFISDKVIQKHINNIAKIAKGDQKAILEFGKDVAREIVDSAALDFSKRDFINWDTDQANFYLNSVSTWMDELDDLISKRSPKIEIGASINEENEKELYNKMTGIVEAAGMTMEEANAFYRAMGFTPVYEEEPVPATEVPVTLTTIHGTKTYPDPNNKDNYLIQEVATTENVMISEAGDKIPSLRMDTADGKKGPAPEGFQKTVNVPKGKPKSLIRTGGGSLGGTKKPSGGGSNNKKSKSDTERYHEIKKTIDTLTHQYDELDEAKNRAFGQDKINLIDAEINKTQDLIDANKELKRQIEENYKADREAAAKVGAQFDENGNITNWTELQNKWIDDFNAGKISEETYEANVKALETYEDTVSEWQEAIKTGVELANREYDLKLEKVQIKFDLDISLIDDDLALINYQLEMIEDQAYDAATALGLLGKSLEDAQAKYDTNMAAIAGIFDAHGIENWQEVINDPEAMAGIKFTADEIEALRQYRDGLMEARKEMLNLKNQAIDQAIAAFDEWGSKMGKNISKMDHLNSIMSSFKNIIDLVGKDTLGISDDILKTISEANVQNATNKLEASKAKMDALRQAEAETRAKMALLDTEDEEYKMLAKTLEHIEEQTDAAEEEMMSNWEDALQAAADAFEEAVDRTISTFEKAMAGTFGSLEELQNAFDQSTEISERYVADYKEIYELSKLNRDIMKSIDETDSVKAKKALRDLQKEINDLQNSNVQMSEYDLEHLRAKYELRLAEIALEEAQNAKSQVRMRRDSEGNYSYVFTADQDKIDEAQQNYEDKLYEMQELNSEYIKEMQNNILQSEIELANALRELDRTKFASDAEYYAKVNELTQYYTGQRNYYLDETNKGITNNSELVNQDWANYSAATGYKMSADEEYVDSFNETIYAQLSGYETIEDAQNRFAKATQAMVADLVLAFRGWSESTETIMATAGTSVEEFGQQVYNATTGENGIVNTSNAAADAVGGLRDKMNELFSQETLDGLSAFADKYKDILDKLSGPTSDLITSINDFIETQATLTTETPESSPVPDIDPEEDDGEVEDDGLKPYQKGILRYKGRGSNRVWTDSEGNTYVKGDPEWSLFKTAFNKAYVHYGKKLKKPYYLGSGKLDADILHEKFGLRTGGYTGDWGDETGRLAFLHRKELVLNASDTENMLKTVELVSNIARIIDLNAGIQAAGLGSLQASTPRDTETVIEQEVTIHAEFPNATNHTEIEEAFNTLINRASQFANRKNL